MPAEPSSHDQRAEDVSAPMHPHVGLRDPLEGLIGREGSVAEEEVEQVLELFGRQLGGQVDRRPERRGDAEAMVGLDV
jgi:hypothetical protein